MVSSSNKCIQHKTNTETFLTLKEQFYLDTPSWPSLAVSFPVLKVSRLSTPVYAENFQFPKTICHMVQTRMGNKSPGNFAPPSFGQAAVSHPSWATRHIVLGH
uniref:Uncharacterized protein n=1 Tax=Micrurus lemniscatus lemniscatus TaxID=129467 RepID=A0A2D4HUE8_MICLE